MTVQNFSIFIVGPTDDLSDGPYSDEIDQFIAGDKPVDVLLRLEVDLGTDTRQILAGIAESYEPESLIGRKVGATPAARSSPTA